MDSSAWLPPDICPLVLHADQNAGNPQHHADPGLLELRHRNPLGAGELHPVVPGWPRSAADGGDLGGGARSSLSDGVSPPGFVTPEPRPSLAPRRTARRYDREVFKVDLFF